LLDLSSGDQLGEVGVDIPRALGTVGEHKVVHDRAGRRPLGQRAAAPELNIVGVSADR
jgi:hypothetical protein